MAIVSEYGDERLLSDREEQAEEREERYDGALPPWEDRVERQVEEHGRMERELLYLEPEANEARAPGEVCERCGSVMTASEDARLSVDGHWMHEVCPETLANNPVDQEPGVGSARSSVSTGRTVDREERGT
ncbi:MAG TPA: hypothetical protein VLX59_04590 [Acidimicrobiales bacterium]|nr:hypothetical protein [Acidimicrobiales bacterium]